MRWKEPGSPINGHEEDHALFWISKNSGTPVLDFMLSRDELLLVKLLRFQDLAVRAASMC